MDRWWASRERAAQVLDRMAAGDDPQMMVGTAFLALHAIGAHHIEKAAEPFGSHNLGLALKDIEDDVLIGAVCKAFDDATGQPGYGAARVSAMKRKADRGAQGVYHTMVAGKRHPIIAMRRAADTYAAVAEDTGVRKSLLDDEMTEYTADRSLLSYASRIADAEPVVISKEKDTFKREGLEVTVNRGEGGRFAPLGLSGGPRTAEEKKRIRQERLAAYMQEARHRKADVPERYAEATMTRRERHAEAQLQANAQLEQELEQEAVGEESAEARAQRMRRKRRAAKRRAMNVARNAAAGRAGASPERFGGELERAKQKEQQRHNIAEAESLKMERGRKESERERAAMNASMELARHEERQNQKSLQRMFGRERFMEKYRIYDPANPVANTVDKVPRFQRIDVQVPPNFKVPVPLMYVPKDGKDKGDMAVSNQQLISYYSGVTPAAFPHPATGEMDEMETAAAKTMSLVEATKRRYGKDADVSRLLIDWMTSDPKTSAGQNYPPGTRDTMEDYEMATMESVSKVIDQMFVMRSDANEGQPKAFSYELEGEDQGKHGLDSTGVAEKIKRMFVEKSGTDNMGRMFVSPGEWHHSKEDREDAPRYEYASAGDLLISAFEFAGSTDYSPNQTERLKAQRDVAALIRAAQVLEMTSTPERQKDANPALAWMPFYKTSVQVKSKSGTILSTWGGVIAPNDLESDITLMLNEVEDEQNKNGGEAPHSIHVDVKKRETGESWRNGYLDTLHGSLESVPPPKTSERTDHVDSQYLLAVGSKTEMSEDYPDIGSAVIVRPPIMGLAVANDPNVFGSEWRWLSESVRSEANVHASTWTMAASAPGGIRDFFKILRSNTTSRLHKETGPVGLNG